MYIDIIPLVCNLNIGVLKDWCFWLEGGPKRKGIMIMGLGSSKLSTVIAFPLLPYRANSLKVSR